MGESSRLETAITVTGLKPGHFYNVRVIAVGPNNFQSGSSVIRLRTYGRDGRPQLPNGRVPSNLSIEEQQNGALADSSDESSAPRNQAAGVEAAAVPGDLPVMIRESSSGTTGRRNTGGRKHSPSSAAADQAALARRVSKEPEESMQQLTEKFEAIRKELDELVGQVSKDTEEFKSQMLDLMKERDEKKQTLKEKEEASEKLKKEVHYSERANRQAQNRKTQKEKALRDKHAERNKMHEDMIRWKKEIEDMKREREFWQQEKERLAAEKEAKTEELRATILEKQASLNGLEEEIRVRGLQIKELEEERKHLPGAQDDEESRERDAAAAKRDLEWEMKEKDLTSRLNDQSTLLRQLQAEFQGQQVQWNVYAARHSSGPFMYHGNSSGVDFDSAGAQSKTKSRRSRNRKSRTSTISSPIAGYPITDSPFPSASVYNNLKITSSPNYAPGPYFDLRNDTAMVPLSDQIGMTEADVRALTAGAPLSPTATSLLPSNIFEDNDLPSPRAGSSRSFGPALYGSKSPFLENETQSPESSSRSPSLMSSPQTSSHNLAMYGVTGPDFGGEADRQSLNSPRGEHGPIGSPSATTQSPVHKGFGNIFTFPRTRGKTMQEDGPALGSLKQGQSQSFPRSTEEPEVISNRSRRISFSSGWNNVMPNLFNRNSAVSDTIEGNAPAPARNAGARRRRGFNMFGNSLDDPSPAFSDRDPGSPRPLSIASSDLPRPSTDSAPFGWPAVDGNMVNRNSPLATNWSINAPPTWSRSVSRRPSFQHGSTTALTSGIASEDDEFLPPDTLLGQSSPPPVGVIGTRPPSSHKPVTPKLNPAAPTFTFNTLFNRASKSDKTKSKEKAADTSGQDDSPPTNIPSSAESSKSRDTPSVHTQNSMAESHESLERSTSNTLSDMAIASATSSKDKEFTFRQLLRKGSSSKFSISSIRGKDSGLFGGKKGPSSATNSDRNASVERDGSFDEYGEDVLGRSVDSVTSSPMIGSLGSGEWKGKDNVTGTPKEGRMNLNWGRFSRKGKDKNKTRESLEVDPSEAETTGTEDEGT